ncbi:UDP-glucosyltransferase 2-like [Harmonia axyridis]|uniref:UDP-glucosyltransferase 2-like n=1 Tax=Harmonia axyridis TaxID=115357 RepID=UPI001E275CB7|nr:UDP-glucosyltransferase 2-like [Harmonia axyridis]XP_045470074.1 UDP-glucosyltransferase 2-like [Harmonia axyridis]XP_045470075.1 UDP-glucosyltransferase 2-like [Harmonia axyridis]XP_045470076.1 UDP-glucosyltransferase 2-like [Harmonia axyridis]
MRYFKFIVSLFLIKIAYIKCANILAILPMVQKSHYVMYRKLLEELVNRGHTVDILGGIPSKTEANITGLNFIDFPQLNHPDVPPFSIKDLRKFTVNYAVKFMFHLHGIPVCKDSFELENVKNLRDSKKKYDLLIIEIFICDCYYGFAHTFKVPVVSLISSSDLPWGGYRIGNPDNPSYIPVYFQGLRPDKSLYDRFWNTVSYAQTKIGHWWYTKEQDRIARNFFGEDMPSINDIVSNTSILLLNSHFTVNMARPAVPNFIEVGGLHIDRNVKPLDKKMDDFIGNKKFIYFSLGSLAASETFEKEILRTFMDTFAELDHKVLWKANRTEMEKSVAIPANVLVQTWMPQLDILCHPNILFFITHTGLLGTQEAIHCGVPMLCIPLFADQYQNCRNMVDKGVAETLELESLTKEKFSDVVKKLIDKPRYSQNAKMLSKQFKDRPLSPMETAMYWIDYVIKHNGAPNMKSPAIYLKWYQYYLIDVLSLVTLTVFLISLFLFILFKYIWNKIKQSSSQKEKIQ